MRPCIISMTEVGATVLHFVDESTIPADIKGDYHIGTPFISTTVAAASLTSYFPTGKESIPHVLVSVPVNLPIDGVMALASRIIKDDVYQTVQLTHAPCRKFFLDAMVSHNAALQAEALTNKTILKDHFPNCQATGTFTIPKINVTIVYTTPDMEETLASELVGLERRIPKDPSASPSPSTGIPLHIRAGADSYSGKTNPNPQ